VVNRHAPAALTRGDRPGTRFVGAGLAFGPVWTRAENLPSPVLDSRIVQLVVSRYTDYAIPVHNCCPTDVKLLGQCDYLSLSYSLRVRFMFLLEKKTNIACYAH
jgi:hypothetical protein